jgi:hypothetical protein
VLLDDGGIVGAAKPGTAFIDQAAGDPRSPAPPRPNSAAAERIAGRSDPSPSWWAQRASSSTAPPERRTIGTRISHADGIGAGHVAKLASNMVFAAQTVADLEVLALAASMAPLLLWR